jgi:hypothetical protein
MQPNEKQNNPSGCSVFHWVAYFLQPFMLLTGIILESKVLIRNMRGK